MMTNARDEEITRIETELAKLLTRQANLVRSARFFRPFLLVLGAFVAIFLVYSLMIGDMAAVITAFICLLVLAAIGYFARGQTALRLLSSNWGDYPDNSHAEFLERQIAERRKRLDELKAQAGAANS
ncbi:MAG: hypothetical protein EXQ82_11545 [Pseudolabrys sp.]|nr:hypothetical protein [Pseudolabrys sp.]